MAGPGAELVRLVVTEEARGHMSQRGQQSPQPRTQPPLPSPIPSDPPQARTQQQRGLCAWQPSGHRGLSELSGPKALAGPAGEG